MAISATLQFADSSLGLVAGGAMKNFWNTYTVIGFDYTLERSYDKTGRPSSSATITTIRVTVRGIKQAKTPFHDWIQNPDLKMSGEIKIFDSTGIVSSLVQGVSGTDDIVDVGEAFDYGIDMLGDTMDMGMEDATKYHKPSLYDEISHKDLLSFASSKGVTVTASDSDDDIRAKLDFKDETNAMTLDKLKKFCTDNNVTVTASSGTTPSIDDYRKAVYNKKVDKYTEDKKKENKYANNTMGHFQDAGDNYKAKTTGVVKSAFSNAATKLLESARCISFTNAYCVSLREHFENNPKSEGELDKSYPWIIEIGIRPEKVDFIGEQVFGGSVIKPATFNFF